MRGEIRLHAYKTNDPIDDEVFLVEKDGRAVAIESPCYVGMLLAYHMGGLKTIAAASADAEAYKAAVRERYPAYSGQNYPDMTAGFFYG